MRNESCAAVLHLVSLDRSSSTPLYVQLYHALRSIMLEGRMRAGDQLPPTRDVAASLAVSRNTVLSAYEMLFAEGYLDGKVGAGTYVARDPPKTGLPHSNTPVASHAATHPISQRGTRLAAAAQPIQSMPVLWRREFPRRAFHPSLPALDAFPHDLWARLAARRWSRLPVGFLDNPDLGGYWPLRQAIAAHLRTRGVYCDEDQVIIVAGPQQALELSARLLLDEGDPAWIEDPGYPGARDALKGAGARVVPVPVDAEGISVAAGIASGVTPKLIYVTPSHQYPLGVTMSLARRLELLDYASEHGVWILEDNHSGEFHYKGRPLAPLQALDKKNQVIYVGTFSKVLIPSLRIGYVVAQKELKSPFLAALALSYRRSPSVEQAVIADFMEEGHFSHHIERMRVLYKKRQHLLLEACRQNLKDLLEVSPSDAGIHLVGWLNGGIDEVTASRQAAAAGLDTRPLSMYSMGRAQEGALLLGYAAVNEREIQEGTHRLAMVLKSLA